MWERRGEHRRPHFSYSKMLTYISPGVVRLTSTYLILDISHEWSQARGRGRIGITLHSTLQELLLLWILLKSQIELTNILHLLWKREGGGRERRRGRRGQISLEMTNEKSPQ